MKFEQYLKILPRHMGLTLLKFRCANHKLLNETSRWKRGIITFEEKRCRFCRSDIEDEMHILLVCRRFRNIRIKDLNE